MMTVGTKRITFIFRVHKRQSYLQSLFGNYVITSEEKNEKTFFLPTLFDEGTHKISLVELEDF
jgi:hypothetical protein